MAFKTQFQIFLSKTSSLNLYFGEEPSNLYASTLTLRSFTKKRTHHIAERSLITQTALCVRKCTLVQNYAVNEGYTSHQTQIPHALTPQILYTLTISSENLKKLRVRQQGQGAWNSLFLRSN